MPIKPFVARASKPPKATAGAVHAKKRKNTADRLFKFNPSIENNTQNADVRYNGWKRYKPPPVVS